MDEDAVDATDIFEIGFNQSPNCIGSSLEETDLSYQQRSGVLQNGFPDPLENYPGLREALRTHRAKYSTRARGDLDGTRQAIAPVLANRADSAFLAAANQCATRTLKRTERAPLAQGKPNHSPIPYRTSSLGSLVALESLNNSISTPVESRANRLAFR